MRWVSWSVGRMQQQREARSERHNTDRPTDGLSCWCECLSILGRRRHRWKHTGLACGYILARTPTKTRTHSHTPVVSVSSICRKKTLICGCFAVCNPPRENALNLGKRAFRSGKNYSRDKLTQIYSCLFARG
jgi:hypothetical protein